MTDTLTLMSHVTRFIQTGSGEADLTVPFGGMNVLLMGSFPQFGSSCTASVTLAWLGLFAVSENNLGSPGLNV